MEHEEEEELENEQNEVEEEEEDVVKKFGQRGVNEEARLLKRLNEVRLNFYNRLSSAKLIRNTKGRIPFTEHMTVTSDHPLVVPEALALNADIKREVAFYNLTRENVKKGMEILV